MVKARPGGHYRTDTTGGRPARAYVIDGKSAKFVDEATYRAKGYLPEFETLPSEDEYHA